MYSTERGSRELDNESLEVLYTRAIMAWETRPVSRATVANLDMNMVELYLTQRSARSKLAGRLANAEKFS